jgi:rhodanese-related sulfurtransferase
MLQYSKLMVIDVRKTEDYISAHIPSSVNLPLLDLVNQIFTIDRWTEIVIVGDSYQQTKLAGESLLRLNFHRIHRLMIPVNQWDEKFESFL